MCVYKWFYRLFFLGFFIALIALVGGPSLALYLYFRTRGDTRDIVAPHANVIVSRPDSAGIEITDWN